MLFFFIYCVFSSVIVIGSERHVSWKKSTKNLAVSHFRLRELQEVAFVCACVFSNIF